MKEATYILLVLIVLALPGRAPGQPMPLSDEELDRITAAGPQVSLSVDPTSGAVDFSFDAGTSFGNGSASVSPSPIPSTLNLNNGNLILSNTSFAVQNLILNLNLCVQCRATTINQFGFGVAVPININP